METQQTLSFEIASSVDKKPSRLVFEQLICETVDDVFSSLGTDCRQAIYHCLQKKYELKKNDVADHILEFSETLEQIFGSAAALLEIQMMRKLCRKVPQFKYRPDVTLTFTDYANALSHFIERTRYNPNIGSNLNWQQMTTP
jgi:hypothetical protein